MGTIDTLDRDTVEGKIRHYHDILVHYEQKYSATYEDLEKKTSESGLAP